MSQPQSYSDYHNSSRYIEAKSLGRDFVLVSFLSTKTRLGNENPKTQMSVICNPTQERTQYINRK